MYPKKTTITIFALFIFMSACSGSEQEVQEYTVTLSDVGIVKKGSDQALPVNDLPADGATLTLVWPGTPGS